MDQTVVKGEGILSAFALGGLYEIGKNMYVIQYDEDIIVIDCGSKFPDEQLHGVDLIIPDISYLIEHKENVRGMIITHGHEDHIGGIPYVLKQINIPIYGSPLTIGLIRTKLKEHNIKNTELYEINSDSGIYLGKLEISFFRTNHSIPDCLGVVIETPKGTVVHTGDFKFDFSPINQHFPDIHKMASIGEKGVLLLLSESTNAERPGFTPSEKIVGERIYETFQKAKQAIFVTTFASNVNRLQQVVDASIKTNRKLTLLGRSMVNVIDVALELGYIHIPEGMLIDAKDANQIPREQLTVLCTGSQGEPLAALSRLASSTHSMLTIEQNDMIIFASAPIPGNEKNVSSTLNHLYMLGANVVLGNGVNGGYHVSGHASQEELKLMLTLMKPKYFVPIHGEYRMLHHHRELAHSVGVNWDDIYIMRNGQVFDFDGEPSISRRVPAGNTLVDGLGIGDIVRLYYETADT